MQVSAPSLPTVASVAAVAPCTARRHCTLPAIHPQCSTSFAVRAPFTSQRRHIMRGQALIAHMGIRAVENFDSAFELSQECRSSLTELLSTDTFCQQVCRETQQQEGTQLQFADILFQPVPWSVQTKKGMPAEYERYLEDPAYAIINVPPNFMFKAKIFKPSRLCAIFKTL